MGLLERFRQGLSRTAQQIVDRFDTLLARASPTQGASPAADPQTLDDLEELLMAADVGVGATDRIVEAVSARWRGGSDLRALVKDEIRRIFEAAAAEEAPGGSPRVVLVVGVNGTGKTTTVGRLASLLKREGRAPLICAADTFRAAAVDQLQVWAARVGVDVVRARDGADPAAVVFDALAAARARGRDVVLVDTAGRLHTRVNLMKELEKIRRVAAREVAGAPHEVLLVVDATVGQNGVTQAREFTAAAGVTGLVLTKVDGTAKGGVAVAVAHELKLPIRYVGVGEGVDDLLPFSPRDYTDALFQERW